MNNISFIGSGNVAHHLSKALFAKGYAISSISSRNYKSATELASMVNSQVCEIKNIPKGSDLLIIAVSDDAIITLLDAIPNHISKIVHTSGSKSINVFKDAFENYGVFYPLQSFSKDRDLDFSTIPILLEASNSFFENELISIANDLSKTVRVMNSESRKQLHLAAVFANNFVNVLAVEAYGIIEKNNLDGDLIRPLMLETVKRLEFNHPKSVMTGPAKRNDIATLKSQEDLLESDPKLQSLYRQLSQLIMQRFNGTEL